MCIVSNVHDQFAPIIPPIIPIPSPGQGDKTWPPGVMPWGAIPAPAAPGGQITLTPEQLAQLLDAFHKAIEAAKTADKLTGQPDCLDPEKAKLEERVAELERRLDAMAKAMTGG